MKNNIALGENWIFSFSGPMFFHSRPPRTQYNHGIEIAGALKYDLNWNGFFSVSKKILLKTPSELWKPKIPDSTWTHDLCMTRMHDRPFPIVADGITETNVTWHLFFSSSIFSSGLGTSSIDRRIVGACTSKLKSPKKLQNIFFFNL